MIRILCIGLTCVLVLPLSATPPSEPPPWAYPVKPAANPVLT
jgi:hypothetical protein